MTPTQAAAASTATTGSRPPAAPARAIASDFQTFLRLLTAQIKNQDPLNPTPSDEFAVQLATFSSVEQQVRTNELLSALGDRFGGAGIARIAEWVGMEARAPAPVAFDGRPVTLWPKPAAGADQAQLVVRDSNGREVQRTQVAVSSEPLRWDGRGETGSSLMHGTYSFELVSFSKGVPLQSSAVEAFGRVVEARSDNGQAMVVLEGGAVVPADAVTALRRPGAS